MAGEKPAYIAADTYTVSKQLAPGRAGGYIPLVFKDDAGNIVLTANKGGIGRHAMLVDPQGKEVAATANNVSGSGRFGSNSIA